MIGIDRYDHMIHSCRRKHIERNYGMNSIMEILQFSYLNLYICKVVQIFWTGISKIIFNSNYAQNSDLNEFACTKFVHISSLMFSGSKMFYRFRGFHRL
jgi:hypothetical protein